MSKALLLPGVFLLVVAPLAIFVLSGAGTHMTPLLLYPFAAPWWMLFNTDDGRISSGSAIGAEHLRLLAGCAINAALLWCLGVLLDRSLTATKRRS